MIVAVYTTHGGIYYTKADGVKEIRSSIDSDIPITVFWYNALGKRYEESLLIDMDSVKYIMTESDPIPWEDG